MPGPARGVPQVPAPSRTAGERVHAVVRTAAPVVAAVALLTAVLLFVFGDPPLLRWLPSPDIAAMHVDFDTFWRSAHALAEQGAGSAAVYDTGARLHNLNPPLLSVLLVPFGLLDPVLAYRLFTALSVVLVVVAVGAVCRETGIGRRWSVLVLGGVLASSPLHGTLLLGQVYPLLLALLVAGLLAERRGRPYLAATCYGIMVALKPSLAPVLFLPAVQRRWRPFLAGIGAAAVATVIGVVVAGLPTAWQWLAMALAEPVGPTPDNASLPGLALRWGLPTVVGTVAGAVLLIGTLVHYARRTARYGRSAAAGTDPAGTALSAVLATGLLTAPIAWHNYLLLLVPGLVVLAASGRPGDTRRRVVVAILALAVVPVSWSGLWPDGGLLTPLAHGLYTAVLLGTWWSLLRPSTVRPPFTDANGRTDPAAFRSAEGGSRTFG